MSLWVMCVCLYVRSWLWHLKVIQILTQFNNKYVFWSSNWHNKFFLFQLPLDLQPNQTLILVKIQTFALNFYNKRLLLF